MHSPDPARGAASRPIPGAIGLYGALTFLAARCRLHGGYSARQLNQCFLPAVEHDCVRLFQNADGLPCAALIWARLSPEVSARMIDQNRAPEPDEWVSGDELWFMDILAPFGHGRVVARHIARNPPADAFHFARLGPDGRLARVVSVAAAQGARRAIRPRVLAPVLAAVPGPSDEG